MKNNLIFKDFLWRALQIGFRQGAYLLIFLISAAFLSPIDFGKLSLLLAIVLLISTIGNLGLSSAVSKFIAESSIKHDLKIKTIVSSSFFLGFLVSAVLLVLSIIYNYYFQSVNFYFLFLTPVIVFTSLIGVYDGLYVGLKRFKSLAILTIIPSILSILFTFWCVKNYSLTGALISQGVFYGVNFFFLFIPNISLTFGRFSGPLIKKMFSYSIVIAVANVSLFLYTRFVLFILNSQGSIELVGYYELVIRILFVLINIFAAIGIILGPRKIEEHISFGKDHIRKQLVKHSKLSFYFSIIILLFLYLTFPLVLKNLFPEYYNSDFLFIFHVVSLIFPLYAIEAVVSNGYITPLGYAKILIYPLILGILALGSIWLFMGEVINVKLLIILFVIITNLVNLLKIILFYRKL
ncbi:MAG: oligosaccharide flippase family protein [Nanoarchaeota archaeon]